MFSKSGMRKPVNKHMLYVIFLYQFHPPYMQLTNNTIYVILSIFFYNKIMQNYRDVILFCFCMSFGITLPYKINNTNECDVCLPFTIKSTRGWSL